MPTQEARAPLPSPVLGAALGCTALTPRALPSPADAGQANAAIPAPRGRAEAQMNPDSARAIPTPSPVHPACASRSQDRRSPEAQPWAPEEPRVPRPPRESLPGAAGLSPPAEPRLPQRQGLPLTHARIQNALHRAWRGKPRRQPDFVRKEQRSGSWAHAPA